MSTTHPEFKLKDNKPDADFIKWNESMSKNYDQDHYYFKSHPFIVWIEQKRLDIICKIINDSNKNNTLNILEVGSGAGHVLKQISQKVPNAKLTGVEPLDNWRQIAEERLGSSAKLIKGVGEDLPIEDKSMDFVICTEVLEHVIDPTTVLNELRRVLKDDGLIITSIPDEKTIELIKGFLHKIGVYNLMFPSIQKENEWHLHDLDIDSFKEFIPSDLKTEETITIPFNLFPLRHIISFKKKL